MDYISSITQIQRNGSFQSSAGLSLIIQTNKGSFVIIDGGPDDEEDELTLLNFLKEKSNEPKPIVHWFFSHAHHDHMALALSFLSKYKNEISMKGFYYKFPDFKSIVVHNEPPHRIEKSISLINQLDDLIKKEFNDDGTRKY